MARKLGKAEIDDLAGFCAASLAAGDVPVLSAQVEDAFSRDPASVVLSLKELAGQPDDESGDGYLHLIGRQLELLQQASESGLGAAADAIRQFQASAAELATRGKLTGLQLTAIAAALHRAKLAVIPEMSAVLASNIGTEAIEAEPADLAAGFEELMAGSGGDPFVAFEMLAGAIHGLPAEKFGPIAGVMGGADDPKTQTVGLLFLQADQAEARAAAAEALLIVADSLSPHALRQLVMMRNWRPEAERPAVDAVIQRARNAGTEIAAAPKAGLEAVYASAEDGSGAQAMMALIPAGKKFRIGSLILKRCIKDVFLSDLKSRKKAVAALDFAGDEAGLLPVAKSYAGKLICHHLALGARGGRAAPAGLLELAEAAGEANWQPAEISWESERVALFQGLPADMRAPAGVEAVLASAMDWAGAAGIAESWYEEGDDVRRAIKKCKERDPEKRLTFVIDAILHTRRARWADVMTGVALWLKSSNDAEDEPWREFAIQAEAIARGVSFHNMPLMRMIASMTLAAQAH